MGFIQSKDLHTKIKRYAENDWSIRDFDTINGAFC